MKKESGRGGARAGAGRPRVPLAVRVAEGSFDASRPGHRRALLEDELQAGASELLRDTQANFREASAEGNVRWAGYLARVFQARLDRLS
jgi:hypothetical protein